jgi:hypothetical protein
LPLVYKQTVCIDENYRAGIAENRMGITLELHRKNNSMQKIVVVQDVFLAG